MRVPYRSFPAFITLCFAAFASSATAAEGEVREGDTVIVTPPKSEGERRAEEHTGQVDVIQVAGDADRSRSLADIVQRAAGVQARANGGLAAFTTLSIRASDAEHVSIYLDGVPLGHGAAMAVDLSTIPPEIVERVEVYRGATPAWLPFGGLAGAVNIVTRRLGKKLGGSAAASFGSFDTGRGVLQVSAPYGKFRFGGVLSLRGGAGDFLWYNDNGTVALNDADDAVERRGNNQHRAGDLLLKGAYIDRGLRLEMDLQAFGRRQGLPGIGNRQSTEASLEQGRARVSARAHWKRFGVAGLELGVGGHWGYRLDSFRDPLGEIGTGRQPRQDSVLRSGGAEMRARQTLPTLLGRWDNSITLSAAWRRESFRDKVFHTERADEVGPTAHRDQLEVSLSDEVLLFEPWLKLVPRLVGAWVRDDHPASTYTPQVAPSVALRRDALWWQPSLGLTFEPPKLAELFSALPEQVDLRLRVKGNVGRGVRQPTFVELFGNRGFIIGNPELEPEQALSFDVGFEAAAALYGWQLNLSYAWFGRELEDAIIFVRNSQRTANALNASAADVRGHELALRIGLGDQLGASVAYTWQDARNRGDVRAHRNKRLPFTPEHALSTTLEGRYWRLRGFYELDWSDGIFLEPSNRDSFVRVDEGSRGAPLPARVLHTLGLSIDALDSPRLRLTFEVRNLSDQRTFLYDGFPLPGRSFMGTAAMRL